MAKRQWSRWRGGHGGVKAETLRLGPFEVSIIQRANGKWEAIAASGGRSVLGEFDSAAEARRRCIESVSPTINDAFGDLKAHEAFVGIGKGHKGRPLE